MLLYVMFSLCLSFFRSLLAWLVGVIGLLVFALHLAFPSLQQPSAQSQVICL